MKNESPVLVIAPHPDDEVLGVGGTIARLTASGFEVAVVIITKGREPLFDRVLIEQGRKEALEAHEVLGVRQTIFLDFPAAELDTVPHHSLNSALAEVIHGVRPTTVFIPFRNDMHMDHQRVFDSAMVALRPLPGSTVREIYAYETLSETNWHANSRIVPAFVPDTYVPIESYLHRKLEAMSRYVSQIKEPPHERSLEAIENLARYRGATISRSAAEAFMTVRRIMYS